MAPKKGKGQQPTFNLSFLDIMFCGFGAVVLLVLIVNSNTVRHRRERDQDLRTKLMALKLEAQAGERLLSELKNSLEVTDSQIATAKEKSAVLAEKIKRTRAKISLFENASLATRRSLKGLESDLKSMDAERKRLLAKKRRDQDAGEKVRYFSGEGNRQYLTGLRLGGKRILFLIDASASMLHQTILGIIRSRNLSRTTRLQSTKWQRVIRTFKWLLANVPPSSTIKVAVFDTRIVFLGESARRWVAITSRQQINDMVDELEKRVPAHGTSLFWAFSAAAILSPRPDNIILLTDGLPTMGAKPTSQGKVSSEERVKLFRQAVSRLPKAIPVNTILFPLEGDPMAAGLFWKLAVDTRGSFLTPSRDWP